MYASEADVLNVAMFGMTAKEWREKNPDKKGNIRDYAEVSQLVCLSNLENLNAYLIDNGVGQQERLIELNKSAIRQMKVFETENLKLTDGVSDTLKALSEKIMTQVTGQPFEEEYIEEPEKEEYAGEEE